MNTYWNVLNNLSRHGAKGVAISSLLLEMAFLTTPQFTLL